MLSSNLSPPIDDINYGDRILAIYMLPNTQYLRFDSDLSGIYADTFSYDKAIPLYEWTRINISQTYYKLDRGRFEIFVFYGDFHSVGEGEIVLLKGIALYQKNF